MRLFIAGDIIPTQKNIRLFREADTLSLLGKELNNLWLSADFRIANLETPLTYSEEKISKFGKHIKTDPKVVAGLKALQLNLITLANNHILDYTYQGAKDTISTLSNGEIPFIGLIPNEYNIENESFIQFIIENNDLKIGVYACTDKEFSVANKSQMGAVPFDYSCSIKSIKKLKEVTDYSIILYHGGTEFYQYPTPELKKICHSMVDAGADVVVCNHGHVIASQEIYDDSTIVYGQGHFISNLVYNDAVKNELIIQVDINKDGLSVKYIPIEVKENETLQLLHGTEKAMVLEEFYKRSENTTNEFLTEQYKSFVFEKRKNYLLALSGNRIFDRLMIKLTKGRYLNHLYSKEQIKIVYDYIKSYAHREALIEILEGEIK